MSRIEKSHFADDLFEEASDYSFRQQKLARFGLLRKKEIKRFDIKQDVLYADLEWENIIRLASDNKVSYAEVPKFPEVRRDLAIVLDLSVTYEELEQAAYQAEKHILREVSLFDIYQGEKIGPGKKSYALSFLLRDDEKTLTDQIIEKTMEKILQALQEKFHATLR
jgi:phenylalanyl-tRNA synthetase beta chain